MNHSGNLSQQDHQFGLNHSHYETDEDGSALVEAENVHQDVFADEHRSIENISEHSSDDESDSPVAQGNEGTFFPDGKEPVVKKKEGKKEKKKSKNDQGGKKSKKDHSCKDKSKSGGGSKQKPKDQSGSGGSGGNSNPTQIKVTIQNKNKGNSDKQKNNNNSNSNS